MEAQSHRSSPRLTWFMPLASSLVVLGTTIPAGCAGTDRAPNSAKTTFDTPDGRAENKQDRGKKDDVAPETQAMADQIERDVADFMAKRTAAGSNPPAGNTSTMQARRPNGRPIVEWGVRGSSRPGTTNERTNTPSSDRATAADHREPIGVALPVGQAPLASDAEQFPIERPAVSADLNELIVALSRELYQDASFADMPLRQLLLIASLTMTDPARALNPSAIPGLTSEERDILAHFQSFFTELGSDLEAGDRDAESVVQDAVTQLRDALVRAPRLNIGSALLCTRVSGFGDFTEFPRDRNDNVYRFLAQTEQPAVVYIEVDDFTSELNAQGEWVTELSQQLVIYSDRDGIPVWKEPWEPAVDRSRNRRQDFFTVQIITLPKELGVGKYHLKVHCRDEKSGAETETSIVFELVADASMAVSVQ